MTHQGIGARLLRKEDDRYMRGRGQYVGDIRLPGMLEVAFLRSPLAHARIRSIDVGADVAPHQHAAGAPRARDTGGTAE